MASTTLAALSALVAKEIGRYLSTTVTTEAVGPDPARWLISTALRHDGGAPSWEGAFVQMTTGSVVRRVVHEEPSLGAVAVDQIFAATQAVAAAFSLSWPLPISDTQGITGIATTFIPQALRDLSFDDALSLTTTTAYAYTLTAQREWLTADRLRPPYLRDPAIGTYPPQAASWRFRELSDDAGVPVLYLHRAYLSSGKTAQLLVVRPAYTLVNGAESTTGPTATTDTVAANPEHVVQVTKLRAYRWLATAAHVSDQERKDYADKAISQEAWVRQNVPHYLPRDEMPRAEAAA